MDPQTTTNQQNSPTEKTSVLGNISAEEKLALLTKVKKYANENYEEIVNKDDLADAEKVLEAAMKNS